MTSPHDPAAGAITFQVLAEIAFGTTARVDLCRALKSARPGVEGQLLAVKRLHPHVAEDPGFATQFFDEVWMTASLKHPNVVEVKGWGTDEQGAYLAVELVQGVPLGRLMKTVFETGEVFSERSVVFIGARIARGLAAAHALRAPNGELLNLVHRDLTPSNVLMGFNGDVKIADFGMAKAQQRLTKTLTGMRKGEPTYMAPEQARADEIDARADLFSLGVILFELFAGRRPWLAKSDYEMVMISSKEPPADLRELRPKIDKELVSIVNRCLEKEPATRFQSAAEIAERLDNWLTVHGYQNDNEDALARFVRRNGMRQMRWFERAVAGEIVPKPKAGRVAAPLPSYVESAERSAKKPDTKSPPAPAAVSRAVPVKAPPPPVFDEATEATDMSNSEWKLAARQAAAAPPVIVAKIEEDETEWGEEIPTLVQKDAAAVDAMRAARRSAASHGQARPVTAPSAASQEDAQQRAARGKQPNVDAPAGRGTIPIAAVPAGSAAVPEIKMPQGPAPGAPDPRAARNEPTRATSVSAISRVGAPPPPPPPPAAPQPQPPPQPPPAPAAVAPPPAAFSPADAGGKQGSIPDAVESRERAELPQVITEEFVLAEADRLSIESVRRGEDARAAAARAERKAALAKMAADAALIAADAVRLARSAGLAAARQRLEEARQIEQAMDKSPPEGGSPKGAGSPSEAPMPGTGALMPAPAVNAASQPLVPTAGPGQAAVAERPKGGMFGMPPLVIAGLGIVAFCIVFLVLWLFFG